MNKSTNRKGFSLLELMIVLAIVSFLSMLALPSFTRFFAKAKRSEAYIQLRSIYIAEKIYCAEHGTYTTKLTGKNSLDWKPEGTPYYTYGFSQGKGSILIGSNKTPASALTGTYASPEGFTAGAAANIDSDDKTDLLVVNENGEITVASDDLA